MPGYLLATCALFFAFTNPSRGDDPDHTAVLVTDFSWLEGQWARHSKRGEVVESWKRVSEVTMEGEAAITVDGSSRITEHLRLEQFGSEIFYTAKPAENPYPTPFKLIAAENNRFVFENPHHDFPQRIIYSYDGKRGLVVRIEGPMDGEERGIDFVFERRQ